MSWERYLNALREKGPTQLLKNRIDWYVNPLLKKYWYPSIHPHFIRSLKRRNHQRRLSYLSADQRPEAGRVFIVICVDTEGPCELGAHHNWEAVKKEFDAVANPDFRAHYCDSESQPFIVNWFTVDWVGGPASPRASAVGYHAVYDQYRQWLETFEYQDEIYWHYHHGLEGKLGSWNRDWSHNPLYEEILSRRILEREHFPVVYRAGNTWEDDSVSSWMNRFLPFDLSSQGPYKNIHYDWSEASTEWSLFQPDEGSYQSPGGKARWMGRSIGIESDQFVEADIEQAFLDAAEGRDSYVSFWLHDYQPMSECIATGVSRVKKVASRYPSVTLHHCRAEDLFRNLTDISPGSELLISAQMTSEHVHLEVNKPIFGEPWLALDTDSGVLRVDMYPDASPTKWKAELQKGLVIKRGAVSVCDAWGNNQIQRLK